MRRVRSLEELIARQLEDAEAADRRERRLRLSSITARAHQWTKTAKAVAALVAALTLAGGAISIGAHKLYRAAHRVYQVVTLYRARSVAPAELPKTGVASTTLDRVPEPKKGP